MPLFPRVRLYQIRAWPDDVAQLGDLNVAILFPNKAHVRDVGDCVMPCPPEGSGVEALTSLVTLFARRAFKVAIQVK